MVHSWYELVKGECMVKDKSKSILIGGVSKLYQAFCREHYSIHI